jgi:hypothetical protein
VRWRPDLHADAVAHADPHTHTIPHADARPDADADAHRRGNQHAAPADQHTDKDTAWRSDQYARAEQDTDSDADDLLRLLR